MGYWTQALAGEVVFPLVDGPFRAGPGTCLHVPPGTIHTLTNPGTETARVLELFCPGKLLRLVDGVGELLGGDTPPGPRSTGGGRTPPGTA